MVLSHFIVLWFHLHVIAIHLWACLRCGKNLSGSAGEVLSYAVEHMCNTCSVSDKRTSRLKNAMDKLSSITNKLTPQTPLNATSLPAPPPPPPAQPQQPASSSTQMRKNFLQELKEQISKRRLV